MVEILETIKKLYGIEVVIKEKVTKGFLSENHVLIDSISGNKFFLKRYRFDSEEKIKEIHCAKKYFAERGIPIIVPIMHSQNSTYFISDGAFFALFPFIEGRHIDRDHLTDEVIISMGETLGKIHLAGKNAVVQVTEMFEGWNKEKLLARNAELIAIIKDKDEKTEFDAHALDDLELRKNIIETNTKKFEDFHLLSDTLVHGDFHLGNIFFDEFDHVSYVFDLEKSIYAPRTFELFRSMLFIFFGKTFDLENIEKASLYVRSYLKVYPTTVHELRTGFEVFYLRYVHGFWVQNEHYLKGNTRVDQFLVQDYYRVKYLHKYRQKFLDTLLENKYSP